MAHRVDNQQSAPVRRLKDASAKLNTLTSSSAPIFALLWWTSQNTAIDLPMASGPLFKSVQNVEPPSGVQQYVGTRVQPYNNSLLKLQATVDASGADESRPDPATEKATRDDAQAARQVTKTI